MTTDGFPNLFDNIYITGPGIPPYTSILSGSGNSWNLRKPFGNITSSVPFTAYYILPTNSLTFPLSEVYYVILSYISYNPVLITLPNIGSSNIGTKTCFKLVGVNTSSYSVNSDVELRFPNNLFTTTSTIGPGYITIYTVGSSNINTYMYYCLPSSLSEYSANPSYGYFEV